MAQTEISPKIDESPPRTTPEPVQNRPTNLGILIFTWTYWVLLFVWSFLCFLFTFCLFLFTFPFDRKGFIPHMCSCSWAKVALAMNPFWKFHIEGRKKIKWGKPYILVANHQSNFDIFIMYQLFRPFKWIAKKEILKYPFVGWGMQMNRYVYFDRKDRRARAKVIEQCRDWLQKGVPVFFFPEGTRSKSGEMQKFKVGAFQLAIQENLPITPIAIQGTRDILGKNKLLLSTKANIRVKILDPIPVDDYTPDQVNDLIEKTRGRIGQALEDLQKELQSPAP